MTNFNTKINSMLDELMEKTHCLCCGDLLNGDMWEKNRGKYNAKPEYMKLEFCYFTCENEYNSITGIIRKNYNRKTKL